MVTARADDAAWRGALTEPPAQILHVRDEHDGLMDRQGPCDFCDGSIWRWRHNGNADCWMDLDGIAPWTGWS